MAHENLSHIVHRHLLALTHKRRVSMASFVATLREAHERRYPDDRETVEWSQSRDAAQRVENDAQRIARTMPGGNNHMALDLLPCYRDALYARDEDTGKAFDREIAAELGVMFAPEPKAATQSSVADLMREAGDAIREASRLLADGKVSPDEAAQLHRTIAELRELDATTIGLIASLQTATRAN